MPVILRRAGRAVPSTRRQQEVRQRAPFSTSRYGPHGAPHDAAALSQPVVVLLEAEDVQLLLGVVPVAADPLEYPRAVVEGVRHDADLGLSQRHELLLEVRVWCGHPGWLLSRGVSLIIGGEPRLRQSAVLGQDISDTASYL